MAISLLNEPSHQIALLLFSDVNECSSSPCENNGTCSDLVDRFRCVCVRGFTGTKCETGASSLHVYYFFPITFCGNGRFQLSTLLGEGYGNG